MAEEYIEELENDILEDIEPLNDPATLYEHFRVVVDKGQSPVRIDKYLFERLVNSSRNRIQQAADAGFVMANGKPVKSSYKVKPQDVLTVMMDRPRYENDIIPEDIPLNIVYEDEDLMVINKPAGLVVHPGCGNYHGTLVNAIAWHLRDVPTYNPNDPQVGLVHRIDKDISGLLVVAKTPTPKPAWACSSITRLPNGNTTPWYGASSTRMKAPSPETSDETRKTGCRWQSCPTLPKGNTP